VFSGDQRIGARERGAKSCIGAGASPTHTHTKKRKLAMSGQQQSFAVPLQSWRAGAHVYGISRRDNSGDQSMRFMPTALVFFVHFTLAGSHADSWWRLR